jgi:hypothetical protein
MDSLLSDNADRRKLTAFGDCVGNQVEKRVMDTSFRAEEVVDEQSFD